MKEARTITIVWFLVAVAATVALSYVASGLWGGEPEELPGAREFVIEDGMTVGAFAEANAIERPVLKAAFGLAGPSDLGRPLSDLGLSRDEMEARVSGALAIQSESASKDWAKIRIKFALWFAWLAVVFVLLRRRTVTSRARLWLYSGSVLVFGVVLGSDPSPMGTVKDAIALYGAERVIFRPRMIAFVIFIALVVLANKFICSWGCQLGTLQDLIFRLGGKHRGPFARRKLPFALTNTVRVLFFAALVLVAFVWATDIVGPIDPFKVFAPRVLTLAGVAFIGAVLIASLFVYRPWCHLLCPFGLVGWVAEKVSVFRIKVDYEKCIACEACAKACPSTVMEAILKRERAIPDCFACGNCIEVCPADAVSLSAGKRTRPPEGKFDKRAGDNDE